MSKLPLNHKESETLFLIFSVEVATSKAVVQMPPSNQQPKVNLQQVHLFPREEHPLKHQQQCKVLEVLPEHMHQEMHHHNIKLVLFKLLNLRLWPDLICLLKNHLRNHLLMP
jgi:hypothetical protein